MADPTVPAAAGGDGYAGRTRAGAQAAIPRGRFAAYVWWAAVVTVFLYSLGYAAVGFALLFFGALWSLLARRSVLWEQTALDLPLAAFGAVLLVSAALSPYRPLAAGITLMLLISGAVYFGGFTWLLSHGPALRATLLRAWALGAAVAAAAGLAYSAVTYYRTGSTPTGSPTFAHARAQIVRGVGPNGLGTTLLLGSVLALGLALRARGRERALWLACALLTLVGLLATGSRASLAGWILGAAYLAWRELRARPRRMAAALLAAVAVLVLGSVASPQLADRLRYTASDVSGNRIKIWHLSLAMIAAHPWLGTGFGTFETAYDRIKGPGMSPEPFAFNLWLNLAVEIGFLGLLGALGVAAAGAREWLGRARRAPPDADRFRPVITALWIGLLIDQLADNTLFSVSTSAALWLLLALLVVSPAGPAGRDRQRTEGGHQEGESWRSP